MLKKLTIAAVAAVCLSAATAVGQTYVNLVSGEASGVLRQDVFLDIGARYERTLNSKMSVGASLQIAVMDIDLFGTNYENLNTNAYGIDGFFRFYPLGRQFYLGAALGYHDWHFGKYDWSADRYVLYYRARALGITGELGWKIPIGSGSRFFVQPGLSGTLAAGVADLIKDNRRSDYYSSTTPIDDFIDLSQIKAYFGVGYAF